jgi:hypothetical protein
MNTFLCESPFSCARSLDSFTFRYVIVYRPHVIVVMHMLDRRSGLTTLLISIQQLKRLLKLWYDLENNKSGFGQDEDGNPVLTDENWEDLIKVCTCPFLFFKPLDFELVFAGFFAH